MATQLASAELPVIRAAGGILLRESPGGDEVMIVFRARHQDWTLPKGKLKDGESFQEAALREVEEETGCRCDLGSYLGMISYAHNGVPKIVMFWKMVVVEEKPRPHGDEITEALWLPVPAAIQCLTYAQEKSLLTRSAPIRPRQVEEWEPETAVNPAPFNPDLHQPEPEAPGPELVQLRELEPEPAPALHVVRTIESGESLSSEESLPIELEQLLSPVMEMETVAEPEPVVEPEHFIQPVPQTETIAADPNRSGEPDRSLELPNAETEPAPALHVVSTIEPEQSLSPMAIAAKRVAEPEPVIQSEPFTQPVPEVESVAAAVPEPRPSLLTAAPTLIPPRSGIPKPVKRTIRRSPKNQKLRAVAHELDVFRVEVTFLGQRNPELRGSWESAVQQHLENAALSLESNDPAGASLSLRAARRYSVMGLNPTELSARAQVLRDEALQMLSWRGAAIQRLLAPGDDKLTAPRVANAMLLRDEDDQEQHERSRLSNLRLGTILAIGIIGALALVLSFSTIDVPFFQAYAPLGFLGLAGALLSAAQQIVQRREDGRIPGQAALVALVLAGALAGLAADAIYQYAAHYLKLKHTYDPATYVLAFVLGYVTERTLSHFAGYSRDHVTVHY